MRIGVVGGSLTSAVGPAHAAALRMDGRFVISAGCFSRDDGRNAASATAYGVPAARTHRSLSDLLAREQGRLDAILILTPTPAHAGMVQAALAAGYRVICEKALATSSAEAEAIEAMVRGADGFLAVIYNYSGYPALRSLRRLVRSGRLGELRHLQLEMPQEGYLRLGSDGGPALPQDWRRVDGPIPTLYLDLGVHLHQLGHYLTASAPQRVIARQATYGHLPVIDDVKAMVEYDDGVVAGVWFGKSSLGHRNGLRVRLFADVGGAEWFQGNPEELQLTFADGRRETVDRASPMWPGSVVGGERFKAGHPAGFVEALANLYADIADGLIAHAQGSPSTPSDEVFGARLASEGLRLFEAMVAADAGGGWVGLGRSSSPDQSG